MTRSISVGLTNHLAGEVVTLATCWKITRQDGVIMGFTSHETDLLVSGVTYMAASGISPTTVEQKSDMSVDNLEVDGVLDSSYITEADLNAGKYDFAEVLVFIVNYADLTMGTLITKRGWMGEVSLNQGKYIAEVRGLSQKLQNTVGRIFEPTCRANLGDTKCAFNLAGNTVSGSAATVSTSVTTATSQQVFYASALSNISTYPAGYFSNGKLTFTSGLNNGISMEIKEFASGVITCVLPFPYSISAGNAFTIYAGCDKTIATCKNKFNNVINFRGEPYIPGLDKVLQTAGTIPDNAQV